MGVITPVAPHVAKTVSITVSIFIDPGQRFGNFVITLASFRARIYLRHKRPSHHSLSPSWPARCPRIVVNDSLIDARRASGRSQRRTNISSHDLPARAPRAAPAAAESLAMSVRSLPHFSHKPIGKTTHKKGMSYSHVNYITRDEACSKTLSQNMPADRDGARPYFEREANKEGVPANARVADTLILALPIERSKEQRHEAVAGFMEKIGEGRIAWLAAFHDKGKDEHNPHCHIIFRDADVETGRKVVGTTTSAKDVREAEEHGWRVPPRMTTKELRVAWCEHLNAEMERHGLDARFDPRRLKEQGIDREPQIHVGPKAMSMAEKSRNFDSQDRKRGDHANVYSLLDAGSRAEHNKRIIEGNRQRARQKANGHEPNVHRSTGREALEKRQLRERQFTDRKATYQEQKHDR